MLRRIAKALLRPAARPVFQRVDRRIDTATGPLEARLDALDRDVAAIKDYVPILLNTISSQNAAARDFTRARTFLAERIGQVEARGEFIRRETLYEMRYARREGIGDFAEEPRVLSPEKLAAGRPVRLNLGCGHIPRDGYLNVDGRPLPGVDIVADVRRLPFEPGEVDEIFSAHLLEHFPLEELTRSLLPRWYSLLRPGGRFVAVVPDADTMLQEHAAGGYSFEELRMVIFGEQEYEGDFHFNMFSQRLLLDVLREAGFEDVRLTETGRRNGACYEMEVSACKPQSPAQAES